MRIKWRYFIIFFIVINFFRIQNVFSASEEDIFPLAVGNTWTYKVTSNIGDILLTLTETIIGTEIIGGRKAFVIENKSDINNFVNKRTYFYKESGKLILAKLTTYQRTPRGRTYAGKKLWDAGDIIENNDPYVPITYLQYPLKEGQTWISQGGTFTIVGKETVTVPVGVFECWKVKLEFIDSKGTIYKYYAPGVGLVKDETIEPTLSSTSELIKYSIQGK